MPVISGITRAVSIARKLSGRYKYLNPTDKFIRKFVPPNYRGKATRFARYAEIATTGGVIYDFAREMMNASIRSPQTGQFRETRNRMVRPGRYGVRRRPSKDPCRRYTSRKRKHF